MKKISSLILLVIFVLACAQSRYTHPTKSSTDFEREDRECEKIARYKAAQAGSPDNPFLISDERNKCLELKFGWTSGKQ